MARIVVNDILDQLKSENQRLSDENQTIYGLLEKCQKFLIDMKTNCVCNQSPICETFVNSFNESIRKLVDSRPVVKTDSEKKSAVKVKEIKIKTDDYILHSYEECDDDESNQTLEDEFKKYVCPYVGCGLKFTVNYNLNLHIKQKHTLEKTFKCDECVESFVTNYELMKHKSVHTTDLPLECDECHKVFAANTGLVTHKRLFHSTDPIVYSCDLCDYQTKYKRLLKIHNIKRHSDDESIDINTHLKKKVYERFECPDCHRLFNFKSALKNHSVMHSSNPSTFKCDLCPFETIRRNTLKTHVKRRHSAKGPKVKCDYENCDRFFDTAQAVNLHKKRFHIGLVFVCDWPGCDTGFKLKTCYEEHKRTHLAEKQFKCPFEGCSKSFKTYKVLNTHKQSHLKRYVCSWPECAERFSSNPLLTAHMNKHQNIRPFKCYIDRCDKDFYIKPQLDQHIRSVHKTKPIPSN